jgi:hypothetical protein
MGCDNLGVPTILRLGIRGRLPSPVSTSKINAQVSVNKAFILSYPPHRFSLTINIKIFRKMEVSSPSPQLPLVTFPIAKKC